jgi:hypothetical protein
MKEFANNIIAKNTFNRPGESPIPVLNLGMLFLGHHKHRSKEGVKYIPAIQM